MNTRAWSILMVWAVSVAAAHGQGDPIKDAEKRLQGTWRAEKAVRGGVVAKPEMLDNLRVVIQGNKLTIKEGTGREEEATFKLDPSKDPGHIDLTPAGKDEKPAAGIYKIKGDMLTLCWTKSSQERPKEPLNITNTRTSYLLLRKEK